MSSHHTTPEFGTSAGVRDLSGNTLLYTDNNNETKTEQKVILSFDSKLSPDNPRTPTSIENPSRDVANILISIMQSGANEFKEKMGRPMTYSEMRAMYG